MNRILLKNITMVMFWLYTGIVVAAPVEEVRRTVDEFRKKNSQQRADELRIRDQEIRNAENLRKEADARRLASNRVRSEQDNKTRNAEDEAVDNKDLSAKNDILQKLTSAHHQQELIEFIRSDEYKKVSNLLKIMDIENVLNKFERGEEITQEDLNNLLVRMPKNLEDVQKKLGKIKISDEQTKALRSLFDKVITVLKSELPEKISWKEIEQGIKLMGMPKDKAYKNLSQQAKTNSPDDFSSFHNDNSQIVFFSMLLAINILAIILIASKSPTAQFVGEAIFAIEGVIAGFATMGR